MKRLVRSLCLSAIAVLLSSTAFAQQHRVFERGYAGNVSFSAGAILDVPNAQISTSHGYAFGNGLYMGAGLGIDFNPQFSPIFADVRYTFGKESVRPYVGLRSGFCPLVPLMYVFIPSVGIDFGRMTAFCSFTHYGAMVGEFKINGNEAILRSFNMGISFWF